MVDRREDELEWAALRAHHEVDALRVTREVLLHAVAHEEQNHDCGDAEREDEHVQDAAEGALP